MINDQVSDLLTRIRNAQRAGHKSVFVVASKMNKSVLEVLKREGLIDGYEAGENARTLNVFLKYYSTGKPVIASARRFSKPGCRQYRRVDDIPRVSSGLGIAIISTSQGVVSDREARQLKIGGEILAMLG